MLDLNDAGPQPGAGDLNAPRRAPMPSISIEQIDGLLRDRVEELCDHFRPGAPKRSTKRQVRYGNKGSLAAEIAGRNRGRITDFGRDGKGKSPLQFIQAELGCDFGGAVEWAKSWLGIDDARPRHAPPPRPEPSPTANAEAEAEEAARVAKARWIAESSVSVDGTVGEKYLQETRGITKPPPGSVRFRYDAGRPALIVIATDGNGEVKATQTIILTPDGKKASIKVTKRTNGGLAGSAVKLPGDQGRPLILAEGPETGLSVWQATGLEVWVTLGVSNFAGCAPPPGRTVILAADADPPGSGSEKALQNAAQALIDAEHDVRIAWPLKRYADLRKTDFNDVLQRDGEQAIRDAIEAAVPFGREAIEPTFPDNGVSLEEAQQRARAAIDEFVDEMRACKDRRTAPPDEADGIDLNPAPRVPAAALVTTPGVGKTQLGIEAIAAMPAGSFVNYLVPDHALGSEVAERLQAAVGDTHRVVQIFGRDHTHPSGEPMCREADLAKQVQRLGRSVEKHLCKRRVNGIAEHCRHHPEIGGACRYQIQIADTGAAIRVAAHSLLAIPAENNPLPPSDLTVIDENPVGALVRVLDEFIEGGKHEPYCVETEDIGATHWMKPGRWAEMSVTEQADFMAFASALVKVLAQPAPTPANLRAAGLNRARCSFMITVASRAVEDLDVTPAMPRELKKDAIQEYREQLALRMIRLWSLVRDIIDLELDELRPFSVFEGSDKKGRPLRKVAMVWSVDPQIAGPTLITDGTASDALLTRFWPGIRITRIDVRAGHYRAMQITDRAVSKTMLCYDGDGLIAAPKADDEQRSRNRRADLARLAEVEAARAGPDRGVAVITYREAAEALRQEHPHLAAIGVEVGFQRPDGKWAGHFGALRGLDRYRDFATVIIAGRLAPPPAQLERQARAIYYKDSRKLEYLPRGGGPLAKVRRAIRMADGTGRAVEVETHPDPLIADVLDQVCRCEIEQALHRLRLVRRTADDPATVIVLTNEPVNLAIHETATWKSMMPHPLAVMAARGFVPGEGRDLAALAVAVCPDIWKDGKSFENWSGSHPSISNPDFPIKNISIGKKGIETGEEGIDWPRYRYRRSGGRFYCQTVCIDPVRHRDPRAALENLLGPLGLFERVTDPAANVAPPDLAEAPSTDQMSLAVIIDAATSDPAKHAARHLKFSPSMAPPNWRLHRIRDISGIVSPPVGAQVVHWRSARMQLEKAVEVRQAANVAYLEPPLDETPPQPPPRHDTPVWLVTDTDAVDARPVDSPPVDAAPSLPSFDAMLSDGNDLDPSFEPDRLEATRRWLALAREGQPGANDEQNASRRRAQ